MNTFFGGSGTVQPTTPFMVLLPGHILTAFPAISPNALHPDPSSHSYQIVYQLFTQLCALAHSVPSAWNVVLFLVQLVIYLLSTPNFQLLPTFPFLPREVQCSFFELTQHNYTRMLLMMHSIIFLWMSSPNCGFSTKECQDSSLYWCFNIWNMIVFPRCPKMFSKTFYYKSILII